MFQAVCMLWEKEKQFSLLWSLGFKHILLQKKSFVENMASEFFVGDEEPKTVILLNAAEEIETVCVS